MAYITVKEVVLKNDLKEFVLFPHALYADNPYWVPSLCTDEMGTLKKTKTPHLKIVKQQYGWPTLEHNNKVIELRKVYQTRQIRRRRCYIIHLHHPATD